MHLKKYTIKELKGPIKNPDCTNDSIVYESADPKSATLGTLLFDWQAIYALKVNMDTHIHIVIMANMSLSLFSHTFFNTI